VHGSRLRFPVHRIYCVGQNYRAHAREMGADPDREPPCFFTKPADAAHQSGTVAYPPRTANLHHEVELVVALGSGGRNIGVSSAAASVFGYAVGVDLTRRDLQLTAKAAGWPWDTAKAFDDSAPLSLIRPVAEAGHPTAGVIELSVDGERRQCGDLADMIWSVPEVVAELSTYFALTAGDLIFTGTPEGVGPLSPGARVTAAIEGVGRLEFEVQEKSR
jgi:fumarylpyruvate hydrolase